MTRNQQKQLWAQNQPLGDATLGFIGFWPSGSKGKGFLLFLPITCTRWSSVSSTGTLLFSAHLSYFVYLAKSRDKGSAAFKLSKAYIWISCCKWCSSSSSKGHKYLLFPFLLHPFFRYLYVRPPSGQTIKHSWQAKNRNCQLLPLKAMVGCCTLLI